MGKREKSVLKNSDKCNCGAKIRLEGYVLQSPWFRNYVISEIMDFHDCVLGCVEDNYSVSTPFRSERSTYAPEKFYNVVESSTISAKIGNDDYLLHGIGLRKSHYFLRGFSLFFLRCC